MLNECLPKNKKQNMKAKISHTKQAQRLYEKSGASAVYDYASNHNLPCGYCKGCEAETPIYNGTCLICGSTVKSIKEPTTIEQFLKEIDFKLLKKQKASLLQVLDGDYTNSKDLTGILHLLNKIQ